MTATTAAADARVEIENATHRFAQATAAYMVRLEGILGSLKTLSMGSHGFDYAVNVSHSEKPRILPLLADLTFDIESEFGVTIKTLAVAQSLANALRGPGPVPSSAEKGHKGPSASGPAMPTTRRMRPTEPSSK
jgi:hypothetical protein